MQQAAIEFQMESGKKFCFVFQEWNTFNGIVKNLTWIFLKYINRDICKEFETQYLLNFSQLVSFYYINYALITL